MFDVRRFFAARSGPDLTTAFGRGVALFDAGKLPQALAAFEEAAQTAGDDRMRAAAHNKRGAALVGLARREDALDAFCTALAADERCAPAVTNIGNLLLEDGHVLDAIDFFEAAIRIDDRYPGAYRSLGVALRRIGRRPESVRALRAAVRLAATRGSERA